MTDDKLTADQIDNWRKILSLRLGPYAFIMPDSDVQAARDRYQETVNVKEKV